ncbi:VF530 family DNA-binding protein [Flavobacterium sp. I3-2]|uniref:VF530 family protein n=1 Tax=Flavobacterium sp. I3-2 TaxID=2748319 RepID=UPI0015AED71E|nr:VF530 family protein [Flavobacterium sp. I3-2]
MEISKDPLHGKKLIDILEELVEYYKGFEGLGNQIRIRCFTHDPTINSSLKFLRKTPWAREKVELLYLYVLRQKAKQNKNNE